MKVLSLFDGISCGMVALERAGIPVERYVAYEIEPNAIKISKKNYPQIEHCGDVTTADFTQYEGFDLLIGGSPCQDLSNYKYDRGDVKGLEGEKSNLFYHFVRALKECKPKYFLLENVASMEQKWADVISEELGVQPIMINSSLVCAAERKRLYWTNILEVGQPEDKGIVLKDIVLPIEEVHEKYWYSKYPFTVHDGDVKVKATIHLNGHRQAKEVYGLNHKCNTLLCDGNGGNLAKKIYQDNRVRRLTPLEYERLQTLPDNYTEGVADSRRYTAIGNGWTVDVIAHIFTYLKKQEREEKQMEFKMKPYNPVEQILFNYEELKAEIQEKAAVYATLVYTDETIKEAKADKANLNKLKKALNDERIKREKEYMQPFNDFKAKINELIRIIDEPVGIIDKQIKEAEEANKREKFEKIKELFAKTVFPDWLKLEQIFEARWLNATVSLKSIEGALKSKCELIENDLATLSQLPEYGFEAIETYKSSLDLRNAMNEAHRLSEMAKRKAEAERIAAERLAEAERLAQERKAAEEAKKAEEIPCTPYGEEHGMKKPYEAPVATVVPTANVDGQNVSVESIPVETPQRMWVSFRAHLTTDEAFALKAFFNEHEINFEAI